MMLSRIIDILVLFSIYVILVVIFPDPSRMVIGINWFLLVGAVLLTPIIARVMPNKYKVYFPILAIILLILQYFNLLAPSFSLLLSIIILIIVGLVFYALFGLYSKYFATSFQENLYDTELLTAKPIKNIKKSILVIAIVVSLIIIVFSSFLVFITLPIIIVMIGVSYHLEKKSYLTNNINGSQWIEECSKFRKKFVEKLDPGEIYIATLKGDIVYEEKALSDSEESPHYLILTNEKIYLVLENREDNSVIVKYNQKFKNIKSILFTPKTNLDISDDQKLELSIIDNSGFENNFIISNLMETQIKNIIKFFIQYKPISGLISN